MKINNETQAINQNPVAFQEEVPTKDISYWQWFTKNAPVNKLYSEQLQSVSLQHSKREDASNYYEVLGVNPKASATEIQNAIPTKMGEINEAIQVLSDPNKRQAYDSGINSIVPFQIANQPRFQVPPYQPPVAAINHTYQNNLELAGRDTRLVAFLVDFIICLLPIFFAILIAFFFFEDVFNINDETGDILAGDIEILTDQFEILMALIGFVLSSLLIIVILNLGWLCQNGQTIGKRLLSIKIVRTDGSKAGLLRIIFLRGFAVPLIVFISTLPWWKSIVFLVNHLLIFQKSRRCGHDLIADTTVIEAIEGGSKHRSTIETIIAAIIFILVSLIMIGGIVTMAKHFTIPETVNFEHTHYFSSSYKRII